MTTAITNNWTNVVRRFGMAGFAFFLLKGILWLLLPFLIAWFF